MSRPHQKRCEGDGCLVGLGGLVVAGGDAAPLFQPVEAAFHHVALLVELLVEGWRASAAAEPVADLVGSFGDGVADAPPPEPGADGLGAVALVAAGKKINGRKRHITVDTLGLPVMITVTPADIQDRDAARDVFWRLRLTQPQITQVWADRGYAGELVDWARERLWFALRIVSRPKGTKGFVVLPRRWKVERTIGWCMNARRNARDYERLPQHSEAHLNWALITMMTRRLTRKSPRTDRWTKKSTPTS